MDVILWVGCLYNSEPTSHMYPLMNWEESQDLYWWLELMVYHIPSKTSARSVLVFIHPPMVHPLDVIWTVWMWSHCLVTCAMVYKSHSWTYWWIESEIGANTYIDDWSTWYITCYPCPMQRLTVFQFYFIHAVPSLDYYVTNIDVLSLLGCFVQWCINITQVPTDRLRGLSKYIWMRGVHGISYTNQAKSKKCAGFISSMMV